MLRRVLVLMLIVLSAVALPTPAAAAGDWDPDDVEGPLDLRWVGAAFTASGDMRITVSFYDGFTPSALPTQQDGLSNALSRVRVRLGRWHEGWFLRGPAGGLTFYWGPFFVSGEHEPVSWLSPNVLSVTIEAPCYGPNYKIRVSTEWEGRPASRDYSDHLHVGAPPGWPECS